MRISSAFPSKYLRASDLQGKVVSVKMSHVEEELVGQKKEIKPVLYFEGSDKGIVMNKTNASAIAEAYGDDTDGWTGHTIHLFTVQVSMDGEIMDGLRVKIPRVQHQAPLRQMAQQAPVFGTPVATQPVVQGLHRGTADMPVPIVNGLGTRSHGSLPPGTVVDDEIPF